MPARSTPPGPPAPHPQHILDALTPFGRPDPIRSSWQLGSSLVGFVVCWYGVLLTAEESLALTVIAALPAAIFLVRLFIIQHDCGHGSFFGPRWANDVVGGFIGVLTLTPYGWWRNLHAMHHATSGNLDRRGRGDIDTLTVREYRALSRPGCLKYRLLRNPVVIFVIGPACQFFLRHRYPTNLPLASHREWRGVVMTNVALLCISGVMTWWIGLDTFLRVQLPISWLASSVGVWLFYVQHQFEHAYWERDREWNFQAACVDGSSFYDLPRFLHWCTGNIGYHHVHHLCPRIPNYHLRDAVGAHPALAGARRLTLLQSLRCVRLKLWDEDRRRLVGFREAEAD